MNFPNKFKIIWWIILLLLLTLIGAYRLHLAEFKDFDIVLFFFWFTLVLFPIISEVSIFGMSVKKDIESAKNEIKGYITEIKNQINFQPIINVTTAPADKKEFEEKTKKDIKEDTQLQNIKSEVAERSFALSPNTTVKRFSDNEKVKDRLNKTLEIERLIGDIFSSQFNSQYEKQVKITDSLSKKQIIVDGVIYDENRNISEIIEIKFITGFSFNNFYFIAFNYLSRIYKFGLRIPVRFIVVSEEIDEVSAKLIKDQIVKINYHRSMDVSLPHTNVQFFKFFEGKLNELVV